MDSGDIRTCRVETKRQIRQVWFVMAVVVLLQFLAIAALSAAILADHRRIDREVTRIEQNRGGVVEQTVRGCQRGNELRRAIAQIKSDQTARTGAFPERVPNTEIDPDAVALFDCRESTIAVTGVDPGPVSDFVE